LCNYRPSKDRHECELDENTDVLSNDTSNPDPASSASAQNLELLLDRIEMLEIKVSRETNKIETSITAVQQSLQAKAGDWQPSSPPLHCARSLDVCITSMHSLIESIIDEHRLPSDNHFVRRVWTNNDIIC
jgi:hypothetical protein